MSPHRHKAAVCRFKLILLLRQELHRDRPTRKRARVVTAVDSAQPAAAEKSTPAADSLMDMETLTSAPEFRLTVNEWLADIDAEEPQAAGFNLAAYMDSAAVVKAPLSSIFGSALMPQFTSTGSSKAV